MWLCTSLSPVAHQSQHLSSRSDSSSRAEHHIEFITTFQPSPPSGRPGCTSRHMRVDNVGSIHQPCPYDREATTSLLQGWSVGCRSIMRTRVTIGFFVPATVSSQSNFCSIHFLMTHTLSICRLLVLRSPSWKSFASPRRRTSPRFSGAPSHSWATRWPQQSLGLLGSHGCRSG